MMNDEHGFSFIILRSSLLLRCPMRRQTFYLLLAVPVLAGSVATASAEVVRFHYTATQNCGYSTTSLKVGPGGATGEWKTWALSPAAQPYYSQLKPTHMVTFRHPYTNQNITVPLAFPL